MAITRRDFLKISGAAGAGVMLGVFDLKPIVAYANVNPVWIDEAFNICPYCGVGCGMIVGKNASGQITYVQGDPDNPHNMGALCSKGMNAGQMNHIEGYVRPAGIPYQDKYGVTYKAGNSERVITPLKRSPGDSNWEAISWNQAMTEIASLIASTRTVDSDYKCTNIAVLGTAKATNEECYLLTKLMRSLGIVYYEHCARL
jgi:formate dehydrogenase major subunit